jgi:hypothetical protein
MISENETLISGDLFLNVRHLLEAMVEEKKTRFSKKLTTGLSILLEGFVGG